MERTGGSAAVIFAHPAFFSYLAMFKLTFDMNLKSASNLNGNLNCSKELEHYAS